MEPIYRSWAPRFLVVAVATAVFATALVGLAFSGDVLAQASPADTDPPFEIEDFSGVSFTLKSSRPAACSAYQQPGALWDSKTVGSSTVCLAISQGSSLVSDATMLMAVPGHTGEFWKRIAKNRYLKLVFSLGGVKHICITFVATQLSGSFNCVLAQRNTDGYGFRTTSISSGSVISSLDLVTGPSLQTLFVAAGLPLVFDHFNGYEMRVDQSYSAGGSVSSPLIKRWCGTTYTYGTSESVAPTFNNMCITPATDTGYGVGGRAGVVQIGISSLVKQLLDNNPIPLSQALSLSYSFILQDGTTIPRTNSISCGTTMQLGTGFVFQCDTRTTAYADDSSLPQSNIVGIRMRHFSTDEPQPPTVRVARLEVTQGVQDWNNSLALVRNKHTAVRVFMETDVGTERTITADLHGRRVSGAAFAKPKVRPKNSALSTRIQSNVATRRGDINSSLNFILPAEWINLPSNVELELEVRFAAGVRYVCSVGCKVKVSFTEVDPPNIVMVPVPVANDNDTPDDTSDDTPDWPTTRAMIEQFNRIESIMPFPSLAYSSIGGETPIEVTNRGNQIVNVDFGPFARNTTFSDVLDGLNNIQIETLKEDEDDEEDPELEDIYLGVLAGSAEAFNEQRDRIIGRAYIGGNAGAWFTEGIDGLPSTNTGAHYGRFRNVGGHELGHALGEQHAADEDKDGQADDPDTTDDPDDHFEGECGEQTGGTVSYDYMRSVTLGDGSTAERPVLGPLGNVNTEVWGLDTRYVDRSFRGSHAYETIYDNLVVINPREVFSFMSYCQPVDTTSQGTWMDAFHHDRIISRYDASSSQPSSRQAESEKKNSSVPSDMFAGSLELSSSGAVTSAEFEPVFSRDRTPVISGSGEYVLELRNTSGEVVRSVPFDAYEAFAILSSGDNAQSRVERRAGFAFIVSDPPAYESFAVIRDGVEIASVSRSQNAPSISVSGPSTGAEFKDGGTVDVSWAGSDTDGDELVYRVYYSTDGGASYRILSPETEASRKSFPVEMLEGSPQARIGVSASDGTRSVFVETSVFSVEGHVPEVWIESPFTGAVLAEEQGFVLDASAYDTEDGILFASAYNWRSSIDGNLGNDKYIVLSAADLTPGDHTITVTVTDSDQMTASASVGITISAVNTMPVANDDIATVAAGSSAFIDVRSNDIDTEGDADPQSFIITSQPTLGTAETTISPQGVLGIRYTSRTKGIDALSYQICDTVERCSKAQVRIAACTHIGTLGDDILSGTSGDDVICGLGGNDTIDGRAGDDIIDAGPGDDTVYGGAGDDTIYGRLGNDFILGHRGNDFIHGELGDDIIYGGGGYDTIFGEDGADELYGEADNDVLRGGDGPDKIHGGRGDDAIFGGEGDDTIRGNAGIDIIYPGAGNNTVLGTSQDDTVIEDSVQQQLLDSG